MLVVLPPSEGKAAPARGAPVELDGLAFPELADRRAALLDALEALSRGPQGPALDALGLSAGQAGDLDRNARLRTAPTAPAARVYTGVLHERLRLDALPARARRRVLIASALWGAIRPGDRIPAYRLSIGARLPGLPALAAWWRPALQAALPGGGLVVDLRSGAYAAALKFQHATVVGVRAFQDGKTISHMVKATRGDVARILLEGDQVQTPEDVASAVRAAGHQVQLSGSGRSWTVDVLKS